MVPNFSFRNISAPTEITEIISVFISANGAKCSLKMFKKIKYCEYYLDLCVTEIVK
jgi:hypothetical protein